MFRFPLIAPLPAARIFCFDIYRLIEFMERLLALALPVTVEIVFKLLALIISAHITRFDFSLLKLYFWFPASILACIKLSLLSKSATYRSLFYCYCAICTLDSVHYYSSC